MGKLLWPANRWSRKSWGGEGSYVCVCISSRIKLGTRKIERDPFKNIHIFLNHFYRNLASYLQYIYF